MTKKTKEEELQEQNKILEKQVYDLSRKYKVYIHDYYGEHVKIGVVSDNHFGSIYSNINLLHTMYKLFKKEGIDVVYHAGDIVDGQNNYPGQHYEQNAVGLENQIDEVKKNYPDNGITTYFIEGNHAFKKCSGAVIGKHLAESRKDLKFLDEVEADVSIGHKNKAIIRLVHPGGGTAYAISYRPQKIIESFHGGEKPNLLIIGHYHKAEFLPCYRNVFSIQAGTTQNQTPYMKARAISAHCGAWILDFFVDKSGINQFNAQFIPFYEGKRVHGISI